MGLQLNVQKLQYCLIPDVLQEDFKEQVFEAYLEHQFTDTKSIAESTEIFTVLGESYENTGDPYAYYNGEGFIEDDFHEIAYEREGELINDILLLLNQHHMFVLEVDYRYRHFHNVPIIEVW